jgi:hypothetical protein
MPTKAPQAGHKAMVTTPTIERQATKYYYPNKMGRIILLAMEEVMGRNGVNAVLNLAKLRHLVNNYPPNNFDRQFPFEELGAIQQALDEMYGPRGGRGLSLRAGHMCFKFGLKEFGPVLGIADLAFRLLPLGMKLKVGFEVLAETFNKFTDQMKPAFYGSSNAVRFVGGAILISLAVIWPWEFCKSRYIGLAVVRISRSKRSLVSLRVTQLAQSPLTSSR